MIFIKGRPSHIYEDEKKNPVIVTENVLTSELMEVTVDQAILSVGMIPSETAKTVATTLHIPVDSNGFYMEAHSKLKPVETAADGIYLAGSGSEPKSIHQSVASGSAAAGKAAIPMSKGEVEIESITVTVNEENCTGCGACVRSCPYGANTIDPKTKVVVHNPAMCHGCGTCVAECRFEALDQKHFTNSQIMAQIDAALEHDPGSKILAFACNWCSYAGSDLAGVSRFQYSPDIRIIRVMCSGRVSDKFIFHAFEKGAQMVWVTGCHLPNDCHYISGNVFAKKRIERLQKVLPKKFGFPADRLKLNWISAAEGSVFAAQVNKLAKELKEINQNG
ncbi:MAG: hydrogenase iron-sulfur subunit [Candidatus Ranarchaeia archaeon]